MNEIIEFNFWVYCVGLPIFIIICILEHYFFPFKYNLGKSSATRPFPIHKKHLTEKEIEEWFKKFQKGNNEIK